MIHELSVHQIELEIQQEELVHSRSELEKSLCRYTDLYDFAPLGYMTIALDSKVLELNLTAAIMLGVDRSRVYGIPLKMFIRHEDHRELDALLEKVLKEKVSGYIEVEFSALPAEPLKQAQSLAGHAFRIDASTSDKADACRIILSDITQRKNQENIRLQYEQKILRNEQFLKSIYDDVNHSIFVVDVLADGTYRYRGHNATNEKLIGISNEELIGKAPEEVFDPQIARQVIANYDACIRAGQTIHFIEFLPFLGNDMWWETSLNPVRDKKERICRIIGTTINITERKQAEDQLRKSEERFRVMFEKHSAIKLVIDPHNGNIMNANQAAADFYGWSVDQLCRMRIQEINTRSPEKVVGELEKRKSSGIHQFLSQHRKADGTVRDVEVFSNAIDIDGKELFYSIVHDITDRKLAENQLQKLSRTLMVLNDCNLQLLHASNEKELLDGICRAIFADGGYMMVWVGYAEQDQAKSVLPVAQAGFDDGYLETLKITRADTERGQGPAGRSIRSGQPEVTQNMLLDSSFMPWRNEAIKRGYASSLCLPLKTDNHVFGVINMYSSKPDAFNEDEITLLLTLAENLAFGITMLRNRNAMEFAEKELRQSEERYRSLFQNRYTVMMIFDPQDGQVIDANPAAENFYGWTRNELLKMKVTQINTLSESEVKAEMQKARDLERNYFNFRHRKADGSVRDVEVVSGPITLIGKSLLYSIVHDITERKQFQEALLESNKRMHVILNSTNAGTWETVLDSNESSWSDEIWHLYGIEPDSCTPSLQNWLNTIVPEDRPTIEQTFTVAVKNAAEFNCSWRVRDPDGGIRWLMAKGTPYKDACGKVLKFVGITLDITERKLEEEAKKKLESRILKSERLETIGTLAGGIAHDFNNILTPILGYSEMAVKNLPDENPFHEYFTEIMLAAERAKNLVSQILAFGKAQESELSVVNVQSVINEALKLLRPSIPSTITIERHIDSACRNILADSSKIHQAIVNLCTNAYQAMENSGGVLSIELKEIIPDKDFMKMFPELHERPYIKLTVTDTGCGMDKPTMNHIFEPFFTTKPVNKGTGLGLSVVHGIITGYKGAIDVESQPGKGSDFHIFLPVIDKIITPEKKGKNVPGGNASILLVDDEQATLKMMTLMLTKLGYRMRALNSPRQALDELKLNPDAFDLVITDLTMPEMTGVTLASEIHKYRPELPVIMMTGYGKYIDSASDLERYGIRRLLKKPVRLDTMVSAINDVVAANH
ncbi:MAG: PAS domain S-box protein [Chlorobiaceae bacterium]|nr:PAS domain S-box protein [Chlorobiaceae bacterium]